jgi:hypothetical protein
MRGMYWLVGLLFGLASWQAYALIEFDQLLQAVTPYLSTRGIDIRHTPAEYFDSENGNPQLRKLENFIPNKGIAIKLNPFSDMFNVASLNGNVYLLAVNFPGMPLSYAASLFNKRWNDAKQEDRVYIFQW